METEHEICNRYEAEFAAIAALDRRYYMTPSASVEDRRQYAARQVQLEELRSRLYAELTALRQHRLQRLSHCRSYVFRKRRSE
jgi:hypothetical protein